MSNKDVVKNIQDYQFELSLLIEAVSKALIYGINSESQPKAFIKMWQEEQHHMLRDYILLNRRRNRIAKLPSE